MLKDVKDEQLLDRYMQGEMAAFSTLYQRHKAATYRYLLRQTRDKSLAEDLHQEVWSKVITHGQSFQPTAKFTTWLYTIARNKVIDHVRHLHVQSAIIDSAEQDEHELPSHAIESNEVETLLVKQRKRDALQHCLKNLPLHLLDVFVLKEEANMTAPQIAEVVSTTQEAAKSRLRYAYKQLADCLRRKLVIKNDQVLDYE